MCSMRVLPELTATRYSGLNAHYNHSRWTMLLFSTLACSCLVQLHKTTDDFSCGYHNCRMIITQFICSDTLHSSCASVPEKCPHLSSFATKVWCEIPSTSLRVGRTVDDGEMEFRVCIWILSRLLFTCRHRKIQGDSIHSIYFRLSTYSIPALGV
ncbi:hypothetical protein FB446DRAFT_172052 [Lentinula raphanica]|nr:hypothetical protein FB446DRAFT_172052 [Lentinula raphanica]